MTENPVATSQGERAPIPFANGSLGRHRHVGAFFRNPEEEYRVLLPFIREGIERGERAFHVVGPRLRVDHIQRILEAGVDLLTAMKGGQFDLYDWEQTYFPEGRFDQHKAIAYYREVLEAAEQRAYPLTRLLAHMEWALEDRPGVSDLIEYEARCNFFFEGRGDVVICAYDLRRHPAQVIVDVMRAHPIVLIGGSLHENPFFVAPDVLLEELGSRRV